MSQEKKKKKSAEEHQALNRKTHTVIGYFFFFSLRFLAPTLHILSGRLMTRCMQWTEAMLMRNTGEPPWVLQASWTGEGDSDVKLTRCRSVLADAGVFVWPCRVCTLCWWLGERAFPRICSRAQGAMSKYGHICVHRFCAVKVVWAVVRRWG